ncbi:MAG: hypothetical protein ABI868_06880 [Acidobacteriota bacterium]
MKPIDGEAAVVKAVAREEGASLVVKTTGSTSNLNNDSFRMTLDLFQTGVDVMRHNLRRRHPEARDEEVERLLGEWLLERPGAEFGDCPGPTMDINAFLA